MQVEKTPFNINGQSCYGIRYRTDEDWQFEFVVEYVGQDGYELRWYRPNDYDVSDTLVLCTYDSLEEGKQDLEALVSDWEN